MSRLMGDSIRYKSAGTGRKVIVEQITMIVMLFFTGCAMVALETTVCARIRIPLFGWSAASPALGLLFSMAAGFLFGEREGGITGLLCGCLTDAAGIHTAVANMVILPPLYFLCGYASGMIGRRRLAHNLPSFMVFSLVGGGIRCILSIGLATVKLRALPPPVWVWRGLIPAWVLTVLFSAVVYGVTYGEKRLLEPKGNF
ncbi:MAG: hypothetical protein E7610_06270 [Ruminococcaceae bacterium]|nr:hypothetical protein [Oscillospiraceae bacterium]